MSNEQFQILFDADGNEVQVPLESPNVRQMREQIDTLKAEAKKAKDLEEQLTTIQRKTATDGLGLDDRKFEALAAVHKGEWTPDAVRQTAVDLGWAQPVQSVPEGDAAAHQRMDAAMSGGGTATPDADAALDERLRNAKTEAEFDEIYRQSGRPMATG